MAASGKGGASSVPTNPYQQASQANKSAYGTINSALQGNAASSYSPVTANLQGAAPTLASQMSRYTNPYENQVVQGMTNDANTQRNQMMQQIGADANAAGAFGGSRHGLVEAQTNAEVNNNLQNNVANLRSQGFNTAAGLAGQDVANQLSVRSQNQQAQNANNQFNAQMQSQFGQNKFNNALSGANALGNMANSSFNMGSALTGQQMQQGSLAQQLQQSLLNQGQSMFGNYSNQAANALQMRLAALGMSPLNNASTTTQTTPNTTFANLLGAAGNMFSFAPITLSTARFKDEIKRTGRKVKSKAGAVVDQVTFKYKPELGIEGIHSGVLAEDLGNDPAVIFHEGQPIAVDYSQLEVM